MTPRAEWVSDRISELLADMGIEYVALNPGASFRGLHDSFVNHTPDRPQMLLCLHEEHAVAIADGYARVTGRPMAVALHANVGLMHATMAVYNAWCDRVPMLILGATGPVDAMKRRPWIDWIHTSADQGALARSFLKWDDQPASADAAVESLLRANRVTRTAPAAPVYVCLDAALQETRLEADPAPITPARYRARPPAAPVSGVAEAAAALQAAERPVMLIGRVSRSEAEWDDRVRLAEAVGARVVSDITWGASFPTEHPLHVSTSLMLRGAGALEAVRDADVLLALEWVDLGSTLRLACGGEPRATTIVCGADEYLGNGWTKDQGGLAPADIDLPATPGETVRALLAQLDRAAPTTYHRQPAPSAAPSPLPGTDGPLEMRHIAAALRDVIAPGRASLVRLPLRWDGAWSTFRHPLDFIGYDGGAAIGSGPGMSIGAALALRESGRVPIAVLGDGDLAMGMSALWTAAHDRIPLLILVANNQTYGNDEVHQRHVAEVRGRPVERAWVGQRMTEPEIDFRGLAAAQGFATAPVVRDYETLCAELAAAVARVAAGECMLIDVRIQPEP